MRKQQTLNSFSRTQDLLLLTQQTRKRTRTSTHIHMQYTHVRGHTLLHTNVAYLRVVQQSSSTSGHDALGNSCASGVQSIIHPVLLLSHLNFRSTSDLDDGDASRELCKCTCVRVYVSMCVCVYVSERVWIYIYMKRVCINECFSEYATG